MLFTIKYESTYRPCAEPTYKIYDLDKGRYKVVLSFPKEFLAPARKTMKWVSAEDMKPFLKLLEEMKKLKIPIFPAAMDGCDGGFKEITLGGYWQKTVLRWWSAPPKEWEKLNKKVGEIYEFLGGFLPVDGWD
jgi:hypothetical protein